jgi:hypothetical protein
MLNRIRYRLRAIVRRSAVEREMREEMQLHLDKRVELLVASGVNPDRASKTGYFDLLCVPLLRGNDLPPTDTSSTASIGSDPARRCGAPKIRLAGASNRSRQRRRCSAISSSPACTTRIILRATQSTRASIAR